MIKAVQLINNLENLGIATELHWIPAHIHIVDNEGADTEIKKVYRMKKEIASWPEHGSRY